MTAHEALAETWASMDGELEKFIRCRDDAIVDGTEGYYIGYLSDAAEMERRLNKRGYQIVPLVK